MVRALRLHALHDEPQLFVRSKAKDDQVYSIHLIILEHEEVIDFIRVALAFNSPAKFESITRLMLIRLLQLPRHELCILNGLQIMLDPSDQDAALEALESGNPWRQVLFEHFVFPFCGKRVHQTARLRALWLKVAAIMMLWSAQLFAIASFEASQMMRLEISQSSNFVRVDFGVQNFATKRRQGCQRCYMQRKALYFSKHLICKVC